MTEPLIDHVAPTGRWRFDDDVAAVFDDMLRRSIPQYDVMRALVLALGARYVVPQTAIVDLGCARGDALVPFVERFGAANHYIGVDVSAPMLAAARARFADRPAGLVEIVELDLRDAFVRVPVSLTLAVLTLQFIPIEYRPALLRRIYTQTAPGGALIVVEKVLGATAATDAVLTDEYLALKKRNGYSDDEIARKRLALEGVLVPLSARWNEDALDRAGFTAVECVWRALNFAAWLAVREPQ